jgi:hypothetical protein
MSFEPLYIQKWVYDTLVGDQTLQELLQVPGRATNYQIGIYSTIAPEKDPRSGSIPQLPYIVFNSSGNIGDETVLCGGRYMTVPTIRVTAWDNSNGTISYKRLKPIVDRIDVLLGGQSATVSDISFFCQRYDTDQPYEISGDGRVDYGLSLLYRFNTII